MAMNYKDHMGGENRNSVHMVFWYVRYLQLASNSPDVVPTVMV